MTRIILRPVPEPEPGELISPAVLEHLFGPPASVPPPERPGAESEAELVSEEFLNLLFPKAG